jgi:hypothetical protein
MALLVFPWQIPGAKSAISVAFAADQVPMAATRAAEIVGEAFFGEKSAS